MTKLSHTAKGIILMTASSLAFSLMSGLVIYASNIDSFKTTLFRFVIGIGLLGTAALFGKIKLKFVHGPFLFLRGLTGGCAVFLFFLSISKLGVARGTVISFSYPIFASIFGAIFLRERIGFLKAIALTAAFAGIYLLTRDDRGSFSAVMAFGKYEALAILGAVLSGLAVVLVKRLHDTDSTYAIVFAQCVIGLWLVIIPANLAPASIGYYGGILLLCIGIAAAIGQLLMTEGYRHVTVTTGSLLGLLVPVLNCFVGILIFHEPISTNAVAGSILVLTSCAVVSISHNKRS